MRKISLFAIMLLTVVAAAAQPQQPTVRSGKITKGVDYVMAHDAKIASINGNEVVIATNATRSILGTVSTKGLEVMVTDTNMKVLRRVELPDSKMCKVVFATSVDGMVYVLFRHEFYAKYYRAVVDPQSMTVMSCNMMQSDVPCENFEAYRWTAKSDNGLFYALAGVSVNAGTKEAQARQWLFDEKLEVLWEKHYESRMLSSMTVNDDGVVSLFGYSYDKKNGETTVKLATVDVDNEESYTAKLNIGEVERMSLLNIVGNVAVAAGIIRSSQTPKNADSYYDQMFGLAFDMKKEQVRTTMVHFTSDELNVFYNRSTKKACPKDMVDGLVVTDHTATDYGGAMLLQRRWKITTHSSRNPDVHDYYTMGSLVLGVDTTGQILWHKPLRTVYSEMTGSAYDVACYSDAMLKAQGDNVYVLVPEQSKSAVDYNIEKAVMNFKVGQRAHAYAIYGVDKAGQVSKSVWPQKERTSLMDNMLNIAPGKYVGVHSFRNKSALVYVNF